MNSVRNRLIALSLFIGISSMISCSSFTPSASKEDWRDGAGRPFTAVTIPAMTTQLVAPTKLNGDEYRLKCGDILSLHVHHLEPLKENDGKVDATGAVDWPLLGRLPARGLTTVELQQRLRRAYARFYPDAPISLKIKFRRPPTCAVLGQVGAPGLVSLEGGRKIVDVVADAGGFTYLDRRDALGASDLSRAFVAREGSLVSVDFEALFLRGDMSQNIAIQEGDLVFVPDNTHREVVVLGSVNKPGVIPMATGAINLLSAIGHAGGLHQHAELGSIVVLRNIASRPIVRCFDLRDILEAKTSDLKLENGDVIYISKDEIAALDIPGILRSAASGLVLAFGVGSLN